MKGGEMKKLLVIIVIITGIFLFRQNVMAAESYKIGVVYIQRCMQESSEGQRLSQELQQRYNDIQKELNEKQQELADMQNEIEKQSLMLSLEAKEDKQNEYDKKKRDLEYLVEDSNEEMTKAQNEAQQKILTDLEVIIVEIAEKDGYDLILERVSAGVLFTSEALDITDQVIDAFNKAKP
jgi:outer membrane protein